MSKTVKKSSLNGTLWTKKTVIEAINDLFKEFDMTVISENSDSENSDSENSNSKGSYIETFYFEEDEKFIDKFSNIKLISFKIFFRNSKPDYIVIDYFKSFHNGKQIISGTRLINKFKKLGEILYCNYIVLFDVSHKRFNNCKFDLSKLEILTGSTAQSWYNSKGFVSDNYTKIVEHNTRQRNRLFKDIIEEMEEKMKVKEAKELELLDNNVKILCSLIYSKHYPDCRELTLYQVFKKLKNKYLFKDLQYYELTTEECQSIEFIISKLEKYIIKYEKKLKYTIPSQKTKLTSLKNSKVISLRKTRTTSQKRSKQHSRTKKNKHYSL